MRGEMSEGEERGGKRAEEEGEGVKKSEEQEPRCVYNVIITYCVVCGCVCLKCLQVVAGLSRCRRIVLANRTRNY